MTIPRLYVPLLEPEDVVRHLGQEEDHWKEGRSAHALAQIWSRANGLPEAIASSLRTKPCFESAQLIDAFLERQVDLGTPGGHSQTDLLAVVSTENGIAIVGVEGKAGEPFDKYVHDWLGGSESRKVRLADLCSKLGLSFAAAQPLRYQLLHRAASAIIEARRYRTDIAVMLIHSFSDDEGGLEDFAAFLRALKFEDAAIGKLAGPVLCDGVFLYAGWVQDKAPRGASPTAYLDELRDYAAKLSQWCDRVRASCDKKYSTP